MVKAGFYHSKSYLRVKENGKMRLVIGSEKTSHTRDVQALARGAQEGMNKEELLALRKTLWD